jgi:hypothetical protein
MFDAFHEGDDEGRFIIAALAKLPAPRKPKHDAP